MMLGDTVIETKLFRAVTIVSYLMYTYNYVDWLNDALISKAMSFALRASH